MAETGIITICMARCGSCGQMQEVTQLRDFLTVRVFDASSWEAPSARVTLDWTCNCGKLNEIILHDD